MEKTLDECKDDFFEYMENTFHAFAGYDGMFLEEVIDNIINYAYKHYGHSKDAARYFIYDLLPDEVEFDEVAKFLPEFG